jgi:CarD family transcriptional regulator
VAHDPEGDARSVLVRREGAVVPSGWSQCYKANVDRLRSGQRERIAAVVEQLIQRGDTAGLSGGERRMLERAKEMLRLLGPAADT